MIKVKDFFSFLYTQSRDSNIVNLSAQMSYRILTAFIPLLMLFFNFTKWFSRNLDTAFLGEFEWIIPNSILEYLDIAKRQSADISFSASSNIVISFVALYISVSAMHALVVSLNRIFERRDQRQGITLWLQAIVYLILFLIILLLIFFIYIVGEYLLSFIFNCFQLSESLSYFLGIFSFIYLLVVASIIFTLIYMFAPKKPLTLAASLPGGIFVSFCWVLIFIVYWFFVSANLDFSNFFFQIQGPFSLLISVYLIAFTLNLGAVVNLYSFKFFKRKAGFHGREST